MEDILKWAQEKLGDDSLKIDDLKDHVEVLRLLEVFGKPSNIKLKPRPNVFQKNIEVQAVLKYAQSLGINVEIDIDYFTNENKVIFY